MNELPIRDCRAQSVLFTLSFVALLTSIAGAQQALVRATTEYGIVAQSGAQTDAKAIKKAAVMPQTGWTLDAKAGQGLTGNARVQATVGHAWHPVFGFGIELSEKAILVPGLNTVTGATSQNTAGQQAGPHSVTALIPLQDGFQGTVTIDWQGRISQGTTSFSTLGCDIDIRDGNGVQKLKFQAGSTMDSQTLGVRVMGKNGSGVQVTVTTNAIAQTFSPLTSAHWEQQVLALFRLDGGSGCVVGKFGFACDAELDGMSSARNVAIALTSRYPNQPLVLVLGTQRISVLLPFGSCRLYVNPVVVVPSQTRQDGGWAVQFGLPQTFIGKLDLQAFVLHTTPAPFLSGSNGLEIECR